MERPGQISHQMIEVLLFGAPAARVVDEAAVLSVDGFAVLDADPLTSRVAAASGVDLGAEPSHLASLRVPVVPDSVWTSMVQALSKQRAASPRVAIVGEHLALTLPLWKHLMPSAIAIGQAPEPSTEHAHGVATFATAYADAVEFVGSWADFGAVLDQRVGVSA